MSELKNLTGKALDTVRQEGIGQREGKSCCGIVGNKFSKQISNQVQCGKCYIDTILTLSGLICQVDYISCQEIGKSAVYHSLADAKGTSNGYEYIPGDELGIFPL